MSRIVLAMSGGVDSSVAAWLLKKEGHEVIGVFMRHGQEIELQCSTDSDVRAKQGCCSASDAADARRVAEMLDIPFYALNFEREFSRIIDYFVAEYSAGRTPNPCIVCNTWLKFGKLFEYADSVGAEYVATGHYARINLLDSFREGEASAEPLERRNFLASPTARQEPGPPDDEFGLFRGLDMSKDQSYVLFGIDRKLLPRLKFPVGSYRKEEIRRMAEELGLRVAQKPDSQEICFIPDQDHARFIRTKSGDLQSAGDFVTTEGVVVGHHAGFEAFTVGQRKGLGMAFGEPRYVVRIEPETRRVVLGTLDELICRELTAAGSNWLVPIDLLSPDRPLQFNETKAKSSEQMAKATFGCQVKIRYRSPAFAAEATLLPENRFHVRFLEPVRGVAPGQAAVCYREDRVMGGGWIE